MGLGLEKLYYPNNSVVGAANALEIAVKNCDQLPYCSTLEGLSELRKGIIQRFYPLSKIQEWGNAFVRVMNMAAATPSASVAAPVAAPSVAPIAAPSTSDSETIHVLFSDMWDQFNEQHNMFTLAMEVGLKAKGTKVMGHNLETLGSQKPDVVIFGPFGDDWTKLPAE
jgi:hypothetical protein